MCNVFAYIGLKNPVKQGLRGLVYKIKKWPILHVSWLLRYCAL